MDGRDGRDGRTNELTKILLYVLLKIYTGVTHLTFILCHLSFRITLSS